MFPVRAALRPIARQARSYHGKGNFVEPQMNELPVPSGSWQEAYNARQRKYNATLIGGILFATFSVYCARASGALYLNFSPPNSID